MVYIITPRQHKFHKQNLSKYNSRRGRGRSEAETHRIKYKALQLLVTRALTCVVDFRILDNCPSRSLYRMSC